MRHAQAPPAIDEGVDIMAAFLKIFVAVLLVVFLAHAVIGWLRPDVMPGLSFLPGDSKYESPSGNVRVYFPIVTSIVLSVVLSLILSLFTRFFRR
jgi:hypothetical protein